MPTTNALSAAQQAWRREVAELAQSRLAVAIVELQHAQSGNTTIQIGTFPEFSVTLAIAHAEDDNVEAALKGGNLVLVSEQVMDAERKAAHGRFIALASPAWNGEGPHLREYTDEEALATLIIDQLARHPAVEKEMLGSLFKVVFIRDDLVEGTVVSAPFKPRTWIDIVHADELGAGDKAIEAALVPDDMGKPQETVLGCGPEMTLEIIGTRYVEELIGLFSDDDAELAPEKEAMAGANIVVVPLGWTEEEKKALTAGILEWLGKPADGFGPLLLPLDEAAPRTKPVAELLLSHPLVKAEAEKGRVRVLIVPSLEAAQAAAKKAGVKLAALKLKGPKVGKPPPAGSDAAAKAAAKAAKDQAEIAKLQSMDHFAAINGILATVAASATTVAAKAAIAMAAAQIAAVKLKQDAVKAGGPAPDGIATTEQAKSVDANAMSKSETQKAIPNPDKTTQEGLQQHGSIQNQTQAKMGTEGAKHSLADVQAYKAETATSSTLQQEFGGNQTKSVQDALEQAMDTLAKATTPKPG